MNYANKYISDENENLRIKYLWLVHQVKDAIKTWWKEQGNNFEEERREIDALLYKIDAIENAFACS